MVQTTTLHVKSHTDLDLYFLRGSGSWSVSPRRTRESQEDLASRCRRGRHVITTMMEQIQRKTLGSWRLFASVCTKNLHLEGLKVIAHILAMSMGMRQTFQSRPIHCIAALPVVVLACTKGHWAAVGFETPAFL